MTPDSNTSRYALPGRFTPDPPGSDPGSPRPPLDLAAALRVCAAEIEDSGRSTGMTAGRAAGLMREAAGALEQPADPPPEVAFNLNETVRVRLNDSGRAIYANHHAPYLIRDVPEDGWVEMQMWDVMSTFGPHLHFGAPSPPIGMNTMIPSRSFRAVETEDTL